MLVLLITGTCATGKSTIGKLLATKHGFIHIEGDDVWHKVKKNRGSHVRWDEIHQDILEEVQLAFGHTNIVITHVIKPAVLSVYEQFFKDNGIDWKLVVLKPALREVYRRNHVRECWTTSRKIIDELYVELDVPDWEQYSLDTSAQQAEVTVKKILGILQLK